MQYQFCDLQSIKKFATSAADGNPQSEFEFISQLDHLLRTPVKQALNGNVIGGKG
jgi:hypothetical protein